MIVSSFGGAENEFPLIVSPECTTMLSHFWVHNNVSNASNATDLQTASRKISTVFSSDSDAEIMANE
jgi:hypothetical protein